MLMTVMLSSVLRMQDPFYPTKNCSNSMESGRRRFFKDAEVENCLYVPVLVLAGIELIFFLVVGIVLCFGFSMRIKGQNPSVSLV